MNSNLPNDMREHDAIEPLSYCFQCYRDVGIYEGRQQIEGRQRQKVKDEGGPHRGGEIWMMDKTSEMDCLQGMPKLSVTLPVLYSK